MIWISGLQLFRAGAFPRVPTVLIGLAPVLATLAFAAWTLHVIFTETRTNTIQNGSMVALTRRASIRQTDMLVRDLNGASLVMTLDDFSSAFEPAQTPPRSAVLVKQGFRPYQSKRKIWAHKLTDEDVAKHFPAGRFSTSSGAPVSVHSGQFVMMPFPQCDYVTVLDEDKIGPRCRTAFTENSGDGRVLSQAEMVRRWEERLRRDELVYSKTTSVHAKLMAEEGAIETIVDGKVEASHQYYRGDYIMCGSRGE